MNSLLYLLLFIITVPLLHAGDDPFPVGMTAAFPSDTIPEGFLECDGRYLDRTTYSELFSVIGVMYGSSSGTNFRLPDYRGQFLRGWSHGASTDPDRNARTNRGDGTTGDQVGTKQTDQYKSHRHSVDPPSTNTSTNGNHTHNIGLGNSGDNSNNTVAYSNDHHLKPNKGRTDAAGNHSHTVNIPAFNSAYAGGNETRPKNINVVWCIRYQSATGGIGTIADSKLYFGENNDTTSPLIYGEFVNDLVQVNGQLRVTGGILANEVTVKLQSDWPDFVFAPDYQLPDLKEVKSHIDKHHHLPGLPPATEIAENGLQLSEIISKQMQKIEELTLYVIELEKKSVDKDKQIQNLKREHAQDTENILKRLTSLEKNTK
ncbi:MAG: phage tail protein [Lentisphaerales bacterium]|nr:phage tail protein [Lentisphaerales bacterium]